MAKKLNLGLGARLSQVEKGNYVELICESKPDVKFIIVSSGSREHGRHFLLNNGEDLYTGSGIEEVGLKREDYGMKNSWVLVGDMTLGEMLSALATEGDYLRFTLGNEEESDRGDAQSNSGRFITNRFVSPNYSQRIYRGLHGYHHSHEIEMNTPVLSMPPYRIGVELEVECKCESDYECVTDYESNWFNMERDGSLDYWGIEFVTIPLIPKDAKSTEFWDNFVFNLRKKARSWDRSTCGLHVHIGREILGRNDEEQSETIGKMLYLYHHILKESSINTDVYGRPRGYSDMDGKTKEGEAVQLLGSAVLKDKSARKRVGDSLKSRSSYGRYFDINLQNRNTIEFRRGKGSICARRITAVISWCELIAKYSKSATWSKITYENFIDYVKLHVKEDSSLYYYVMSHLS